MLVDVDDAEKNKERNEEINEKINVQQKGVVKIAIAIPAAKNNVQMLN